jgi:hypothetical protein
VHAAILGVEMMKEKPICTTLLRDLQARIV